MTVYSPLPAVTYVCIKAKPDSRDAQVQAKPTKVQPTAQAPRRRGFAWGLSSRQSPAFRGREQYLRCQAKMWQSRQRSRPYFLAYPGRFETKRTDRMYIFIACCEALAGFPAYLKHIRRTWAVEPLCLASWRTTALPGFRRQINDKYDSSGLLCTYGNILTHTMYILQKSK